MMHPHTAKVLADARIDEMVATAERHRLRQLARRQRHRATEEPTADHRRQTTDRTHRLSTFRRPQTPTLTETTRPICQSLTSGRAGRRTLTAHSHIQ